MAADGFTNPEIESAFNEQSASLFGTTGNAYQDTIAFAPAATGVITPVRRPCRAAATATFEGEPPRYLPKDCTSSRSTPMSFG